MTKKRLAVYDAIFQRDINYVLCNEEIGRGFGVSSALC